MKDEIIAELWQIKDELAREANYDVHVLCRELRKGQTTSLAQVVDRSAGAASTRLKRRKQCNDGYARVLARRRLVCGSRKGNPWCIQPRKIASVTSRKPY